jgi:hypothetical protein
MTDQIEQLIESYYEDSIELADNKLLCFKRIDNYRHTGRKSVDVSIEDLETGTQIGLATYFDAKWSFISPANEKLFWQTVKLHQLEVKDVFNRMRDRVPSAYGVKIKSFSSMTSSKLNKLNTIFKN